MKYVILSVGYPSLITLSAGIASYAFHAVFLIIVMIGVVDMYKRVKDFFIVRQKIENGMSVKMVANRYRLSMCQRHACLAAALSVGRFNDFNLWFKSNGYRYYHIFPEGGIFNKRFIKSFIFH